MSTLARRESALAVPTRQELEALGPGDRWTLEERLDEAQDVLREFNDEELRRWVEVEEKTQTEIARLVGRAQASVSERCRRLGIQPTSPRGRPRNIGPDNSPAEEVIDAEVVEEEPQPRPPTQPPASGPAYAEPEPNARAPRTDVVAVVSGVLLRAGEAAEAAGRISKTHLAKRPDEAARSPGAQGRTPDAGRRADAVHAARLERLPGGPFADQASSPEGRLEPPELPDPGLRLNSKVSYFNRRIGGALLG